MPPLTKVATLATITTTDGWLTITTDDCLATSPTGVADCTADAVTGTGTAAAATAVALLLLLLLLVLRVHTVLELLTPARGWAGDRTKLFGPHVKTINGAP